MVENLMAEVCTKPAKAKKEKAPKGPSKREQARQAALKQLAELDAEKAVQLADAKTAEIKKAIKAINKANAPPKVKKASSKSLYPTTEYTQRRFRHNGNDVLGINGKFLRVAIHKETRKVHRMVEENWSDEATALLPSVYTEKNGDLYDPPKTKKAKATKVAKKPAAKKVKKAKKAPAPAVEEKTEEKTDDKPEIKKSQADLIASLVADSSEVVNTAPATAEDKKPAPSVEAVTQQYAQMKVNDDQVEEELEEEVVESDDEDLEELEEISDSDEDEEEVEFDEDDVKEFEHTSLPGEKLFIDSEFHVFNEDQELVGTYNAATDTIF